MDDDVTVNVITSGNGIAILQINRPAQRNSLNLNTKRQLIEALGTLESDANVRAIIITGAGKFFVAGTDIAEMCEMSASSHRELKTGEIFEQVRNCTKLTIAAVEGYALGGGCELALACDLIVSGKQARFGQPEIKVGIMPGAGGTQVLLRAAGKHWTMKKVLTGEPFLAEEAFQMGLISEVVDDGAALDGALKLARLINEMPAKSVQAIREAMRVGGELPLADALAHERSSFELLFESNDQKEGMRAFLEKRRPNYTGR